MAVAFLDSNVLIYAYTNDRRAEIAQLLALEPYCISVQVLNEFANVALRKLGHGWDEIEPALADIAAAAVDVRALTLDTHRHGVALARRYRLQVYDGVLIASALEAGCDTLFSEDMHDGLIVEDRLTVRNPFA